MDNIKTWTVLLVEKSVRMAEDRDKWKKVQKAFAVPYVVYVDFEIFLTPSANKDDSVSEHVPSGFCCLKVSRVDDEIFEPCLCLGADVVAKFFDHIYDEKKRYAKR